MHVCVCDNGDYAECSYMGAQHACSIVEVCYVYHVYCDQPDQPDTPNHTGINFPSNWKISVTASSSAMAILKARSTDGFVLPFSMLMIVCLLTPTRTASSSCVICFSKRSTRMRFFMEMAVIKMCGNEKRPAHSTDVFCISKFFRGVQC